MTHSFDHNSFNWSYEESTWDWRGHCSRVINKNKSREWTGLALQGLKKRLKGRNSVGIAWTNEKSKLEVIVTSFGCNKILTKLKHSMRRPELPSKGKTWLLNWLTEELKNNWLLRWWEPKIITQKVRKNTNSHFTNSFWTKISSSQNEKVNSFVKASF